MVELKEAFIDGDIEIFNRILKVMNKLHSQGIYIGKLDRLQFSTKAHLVRYNNEDIGFIYMINENYLVDDTESIYVFIDMGIIKQYQHHGIGKYVLEQYVKMYGNRCHLIGEVSKDNIASNKMCQEFGKILIQGDRNYYLLGRNIDFDLEEFKDAILNKKDFIKTKKR